MRGVQGTVERLSRHPCLLTGLWSVQPLAWAQDTIPPLTPSFTSRDLQRRYRRLGGDGAGRRDRQDVTRGLGGPSSEFWPPRQAGSRRRGLGPVPAEGKGTCGWQCSPGTPTHLGPRAVVREAPKAHAVRRWAAGRCAPRLMPTVWPGLPTPMLPPLPAPGPQQTLPSCRSPVALSLGGPQGPDQPGPLPKPHGSAT